MSAHPLLFDIGSRGPTTRQIADRVKAGGTAALTEAERRADEARYQEVICRSALNRHPSERMADFICPIHARGSPSRSRW